MALVGTDVTPNTIPAPDQSGGATWGTIAVPQAGLYSPGYADIGAQAFETGQSALRARNLSVFNAYTQLNPGASPQDLADAAQRISGGDNWITGDSQAPALYKAISDKNRLTLEAQQTAQKTDISSAIEAALQKSALTASDAKDWMQKAKSQLPQSAWAAVDAYLGPQNTEAKFNTYQQARVQNAVDIGIKNEWTLDNYKAYFNDDRLAKMAMDMSQTQIKNAQDTLKSKLNLEGAQASSAAADARLRQAQALVEPTIGQENLARAAYETAQTKELQANTEKTVNDIEQNKRDYFVSLTQQPGFINSALQSQDSSRMPDAYRMGKQAYVGKFGRTDPNAPAEYDAMWSFATREVAQQVAADKVKNATVTGQIAYNTGPGATTGRLKTIYDSPGDGPLAGVDTTVIAAAGKNAADTKILQQKAAAVGKALTSDPKFAVNDEAAFKRIIAEQVVASDGNPNVQAIANILTSTKSAINGYPVAAGAEALQTLITRNQPGYYATATGVMPLIAQVKTDAGQLQVQAKSVLGSISQVGKTSTGQSLPIPSATVQKIQALDAQIQSQRQLIQRHIADLKDPQTFGIYYDKDKAPAALADLANLDSNLADLQAQIAQQAKTHPELNPATVSAATVSATPILVANKPFVVNTDTATVRPEDVTAMPNVVQGALRRVAGGARFTTPASSPLTPEFIDNMNSPNWQQEAALAIQETQRALKEAQVAPQRNAGWSSYTPPAAPPPTQLEDSEQGAIVDRLSNDLRAKGADQRAVSIFQDQMKRLLRMLRDQGQLDKPPSLMYGQTPSATTQQATTGQ